MLNPEYYLGAFRRPGGEWHTTKFSDSATSDLRADEDFEPSIWERRPFYCVPVPGESAWSTHRSIGTPLPPSTPLKSG